MPEHEKVKTMSIKEEINKAIGAHGMWKFRLDQAVEKGTSEFTVDNVRKDNLCDFGRWLYGPTVPAAMKKMPGRELPAPPCRLP